MVQKAACVILVISLAAFLSCGIDEYYYLPQVSEANITRTFNNDAVINFPRINQYYYATNYTIFYRIYISEHDTGFTDIQSQEQRNSISASLVSDFNALQSVTDPTITTAIPSINTFSGRNYFRLELEEVDINNILSVNGGSLRLSFPTAQWGFPVAFLNNSNQEIRLRRSSELISLEPRGDPFFRNTADLSDYEKANSEINADVAGRNGASQHAYVSMYIVATGYNNELFSPIYSKPTHISIFKLPNTN